MRCGAIVLTVAAVLSAAVLGSGAALAQATTPVTPQGTNVTSTVTNCMMSCNSTLAQCQTTCVVPGASGSSIAAQTTSTPTVGNGSIGSACQLACTTAQLTCSSICSQQSPSR